MSHAPFQGPLMRLLFSTFPAAVLLCCLQSCASPGQVLEGDPTVSHGPSNPDSTELIPQLENSIAEHLFQQAFDEMIARSPERQPTLGLGAMIISGPTDRLSTLKTLWRPLTPGGTRSAMMSITSN